jgi:hypothetical protein
MKIIARICLIAMVIAFSLQTTAMAEWKLKPASEIGKNLFGMGVEKAKENPDKVEAAAKKLTGEDESVPEKPEDDKGEKEDKKNDE